MGVLSGRYRSPVLPQPISPQRKRIDNSSVQQRSIIQHLSNVLSEAEQVYALSIAVLEDYTQTIILPVHQLEPISMTEAEFNEVVDGIMYSIEESIDNSGADMDYENSSGMLTITCEGNGSQIILSRQAPLREIWLAARSGGFHFNLQNTEEGDVWLNTLTAEPLVKMLSEACLAQSGDKINFDF